MEDLEKFKDITNKLNSDPNLQFIIREQDLEFALNKSKINDVVISLKKCALYGKRAIIVTMPKTLYIPTGDYRPEAKKQWSEDKVSIRLRDLYEQYNSVPAFKENFYFIPEKIQVTAEEWDNDEFAQYDIDSFVFSNVYQNKYGINVSLSDPCINQHIFESLNCKGDELSVYNMWLPELKNVPFDILLKLRNEEQDSFTKFHFALKELIASFEDLNSETKLKELFQKVDYEVRTFEDKLKIIKKNRAIKAYEAIVGFSVMGLCLALPSDVAKIISSVIGIYGGNDFIKALFREREQINNIKISDFYIPWLCTKKSKR